MIRVKIVDELTISPLIRKYEKVWDLPGFFVFVRRSPGRRMPHCLVASFTALSFTARDIILHDHLQTLPALIYVEIGVIDHVDAHLPACTLIQTVT